MRKAGQRLERTEPAPARPVEEEYTKDFINSPQHKALSTPSFLVVSGSQGIGKPTMLNNLMCEHVKNGKSVLPLGLSVRPGEDLKLNEICPDITRQISNLCWDGRMRRPSAEQAVSSWFTSNSQPKAAETNLGGMLVMTLLPPSVPSLATSPTTMPRASSFWRSACLAWQTSLPKAGGGATAAFRRLHVCGQGGGEAGKRLPDAEEGSCRR